jgi:hypothetical protein
MRLCIFAIFVKTIVYSFFKASSKALILESEKLYNQLTTKLTNSVISAAAAIRTA